jgi:hypothetical protein
MAQAKLRIAGVVARHYQLIQAQMSARISEIPEFRNLKTWITNVRNPLPRSSLNKFSAQPLSGRGSISCFFCGQGPRCIEWMQFVHPGDRHHKPSGSPTLPGDRENEAEIVVGALNEAK